MFTTSGSGRGKLVAADCPLPLASSIEAAGPAVAVALNATGAPLTPAITARRDCGPAAVPSVHVVRAVPSALVVDDAGCALPPPETTDQVTATSAAGAPARDTATTTCVGSGCPATPVCASPLALGFVPTKAFGDEAESPEPSHAAAAQRNTAPASHTRREPGRLVRSTTTQTFRLVHSVSIGTITESPGQSLSTSAFPTIRIEGVRVVVVRRATPADSSFPLL